ncbi:MAG: sortase [Patescibacteria group bacterium]
MEYREFKPAKAPFFIIALMMFFLTLAAFTSIGFVPSYVDGISPTIENRFSPTGVVNEGDESVSLADLPDLGEPVVQPFAVPIAPTEVPVDPERLVIHTIGVDLPVNNPEQTAIAALDYSLLTGAVRYPLSARLNEMGNVFLFGHSSSLPVVKNQMFKAFNRISELESGDTIQVIGGGMVHVYRVTSVRRTDVADALVDISTDSGRHLTLSTCDSFGGKSSRFVVEADFFGAYKE